MAENQPSNQGVEMKMPQEPVATPGATQQPMTDSSGAIQSPAPKKPWLAITLGIAIVVLVLILGGLYLWGAVLSNKATDSEDSAMMEEENAMEEEEVGPQESTPSDDIEAIEADLEADFGDIDAELDAIDAELEAEATSTQ